MTDYGRPIEFGVFPVPNAADYEDIVELVVAADQAGLDFVGIQDHPYQKRYLDTMVLIADLLARTSQIRFFPDVANLPLRPPAVLAKTAASLDVMSGGRFELGLGAGGFWEAITAIGGPQRSPGEALKALEEAIDISRLMWSDERSIRYTGEHYSVSGVKPGPQPAHPMEIWLGVYGPRALALLGRTADGWLPSVPSMPIEVLDEKHAIIDAAAREAGRDPASIRRLANVNGVITDGESNGFLEGPPDQWVDELTMLATQHGIDTFILWSKGDLNEQTLRFAELVPTIRQSIAAAR